MHCTHALLLQCGLDVGQSLSPMHWTQPAGGGFVIPHRTGPVAASPLLEPPPSPLALPEAVPLELPPDAPLAVPVEVPLELPVELPVADEPLEPLVDEPLPLPVVAVVPLPEPEEEPEPPSGLLEVDESPPQPIPMAMAAAIEKPTHVLNADMGAPSFFYPDDFKETAGHINCSCTFGRPAGRDRPTPWLVTHGGSAPGKIPEQWAYRV